MTNIYSATQDETEAVAAEAWLLSDKVMSTAHGMVDEKNKIEGLVIHLMDEAAKEAFDRKVEALPETHPIRSVPILTQVSGGKAEAQKNPTP